MISNLGLNWVLIYGKLGAPAMGVAGAALATSIGTGLGLMFLFVAFLRAPERAGRSRWPWRAELRRMLRFGLPNGFNWFLEFAAYIVFLDVVVAHLGTHVLAALNVVMTLNSVSFMPAFGVASAGAILAGQAIGRGEKPLVPGILRLTAKVALAWQGVVGLSYLLVPGLLIGWAGGEATRAVAIPMLGISAAWQVFDALSMTIGEALRAAGDTAWCLWARLAIAWLAFVPIASFLVLELGQGHVAVMLCLVGYLALLALAFALRFRSGRWRAIDLTGEAMPVA
jgi:MATE family multidrug resistance protein